MTLGIEAELRQFELGESAFVGNVQPLGVDMLDRLGTAFLAHFEASGDLRYLNAILKILDREAFRQYYADHYRRLSRWADNELNALRRNRGLQ